MLFVVRWLLLLLVDLPLAFVFGCLVLGSGLFAGLAFVCEALFFELL